MVKIIGLAGRKHSGKSELRKACEARGFHWLYFAQPLKELCCALTGYDMDTLNAKKQENHSFKFGGAEAGLVSDLTGIELDVCKDFFETNDGMFNSVRDILQLVGTGLIREHDPDWHVNRTLDSIVRLGEDANVVIDDVRFPNELALINGTLNGRCFFVMRPSCWEVSNHASETGLKWYHMAGNEIVNDRPLEELLKEWGDYLDRVKGGECALWVETTFWQRVMGSYGKLDNYMNENRLAFTEVDKNTDLFVNYVKKSGTDVRWWPRGVVFANRNKDLLKPLAAYTGYNSEDIAPNDDKLNVLTVDSPYLSENLKALQHHGLEICALDDRTL